MEQLFDLRSDSNVKSSTTLSYLAGHTDWDIRLKQLIDWSDWVVVWCTERDE